VPLLSNSAFRDAAAIMIVCLSGGRNEFCVACPCLSVKTLLLSLLVVLLASVAEAQTPAREDEVVASLAGGRVIVHVAGDRIIFAAIDQTVEAGSIPPRVIQIDARHIGVLLGASEWRLPADAKPIRIGANLPRLTDGQAPAPAYSEQIAPDLEAIGVAFLENLRPLVAQLHYKVDFPSGQPLFELIIIGYAPDTRSPEVIAVDYFMVQELVSSRGAEYWQTRVLRPRFSSVYPPEDKHAPRTLLELRYPQDAKGPTLAELIQGNDPHIARLRTADPRFAKVIENVARGQAQKSAPDAAADFLRAALPLIAGGSRFILGTMDEQRGFDWIVPPDEPAEKPSDGTADDKARPPEAPSLRRRPKP
jgi:hypothetical protein